MSPGERGPLAGTDQIALSTTRPELETEARPAAKARNMRRSPRGGGSEALRRAATAVPVTWLTQTRMRSRSPTAKMALSTSSPPVTCHLPLREVPRLGSSRPEVSLLEEAGAEAAREETSTAEAAMLESHPEQVELVPVQPLTADPPSRRVESSKAHLRILGPKTWAKEPTEERRKRKQLMAVQLRVRLPSLLILFSLHQLLPPHLLLLLRTEESGPSTEARPITRRHPEGPACCLCPCRPGASKDGVAATAAPSISKTSRLASVG